MATTPKAVRKYSKASSGQDKAMTKMETAAKSYSKAPTKQNKDKVNVANKAENKAYAKKEKTRNMSRKATGL